MTYRARNFSLKYLSLMITNLIFHQNRKISLKWWSEEPVSIKLYLPRCKLYKFEFARKSKLNKAEFPAEFTRKFKQFALTIRDLNWYNGFTDYKCGVTAR